MLSWFFIVVAVVVIWSIIYLLIPLTPAADVLFEVTKENGNMAIVTEVDVNPGDSGTIKLIPVDNTGSTGVSIENVDFVSGSGDVVLTADIEVPLLFLFSVGVDAAASDVPLDLSADGKIGEGVAQISRTLIMHIKSKEAVDVKFDVNVTTVTPVPVPEPDPAA